MATVNEAARRGSQDVPRGELVRLVSEASGDDAATVDRVLSSLVVVLGDVFASRRRVKVRGFGTFYPRDRAATVRARPDTGELLQVPASVVVAFRASPILKRRMTVGA